MNVIQFTSMWLNNNNLLCNKSSAVLSKSIIFIQMTKETSFLLLQPGGCIVRKSIELNPKTNPLLWMIVTDSAIKFSLCSHTTENGWKRVSTHKNSTRLLFAAKLVFCQESPPQNELKWLTCAELRTKRGKKHHYRGSAFSSSFWDILNSLSLSLSLTLSLSLYACVHVCVCVCVILLRFFWGLDSLHSPQGCRLQEFRNLVLWLFFCTWDGDVNLWKQFSDSWGCLWSLTGTSFIIGFMLTCLITMFLLLGGDLDMRVGLSIKKC